MTGPPHNLQLLCLRFGVGTRTGDRLYQQTQHGTSDAPAPATPSSLQAPPRAAQVPAAAKHGACRRRRPLALAAAALAWVGAAPGPAPGRIAHAPQRRTLREPPHLWWATSASHRWASLMAAQQLWRELRIQGPQEPGGWRKLHRQCTGCKRASPRGTVQSRLSPLRPDPPGLWLQR